MKNLTFRFPKESDLELLLDHINTASAEETYIMKQGGQLTKKDEKEYLSALIKNIDEKKAVMLMAFEGEQFVGTADVRAGIGAEKHVGTFGIIIRREYRGQGAGTALMQKTIKKAIDHITGLEIISLGVFSNNAPAIHLYEKFGFQKYGELPQGIIWRGEYHDHLLMYLNVKNAKEK